MTWVNAAWYDVNPDRHDEPVGLALVSTLLGFANFGRKMAGLR